MDDYTSLGIIGLGAMGTPMAHRLLDAGRTVTITARRPRPDLVEAGAIWADTPRLLGASCDIVLLMLPDLPQVEEVLTGPDGLLADTNELLLLIGSTSSATGVRDLDRRLRERSGDRIRTVDCPVSGGEDGAAAGTLSIMLGGTEEDARYAAAALAPCGNPVHLGPLGAGQVAKACNQMVVAATILALGEASVLASRSGLDLARMWALLGGGYAGGTLLESRKEKIVTADYSPSGVAKYMTKDLAFATEIAGATDTNTALLPALSTAFGELVDQGHGEEDIAVTRKFIEDRSPR
ncbi:NAD-binding protein [Pseudactinotalea sp. HY160]|uniref:NAD(P)-dependent oxidoreductase n=1 Tax=Pseudactinotalea sp. HY160 TaxID=2654490 RepID=UPI00128C6E86|nr:NAD(P)-dependent oxidoreductase [Pseudactinotalea sp. HY160]MPV48542.1 NAD-binding protein [Pseudactinotalea sp. HY160]